MKERPDAQVGARHAREWGHAVELKVGGSRPLFVQIAESVVEDVRRGVLRPGDPLPGSRPLAEALGVHRNTVLAALRELERQGWITTQRARGTFIASDLPEPLPAQSERRASAGCAFPVPATSLVAAQPPASRALLMLGGVPDLRPFPRAALARAYRRALQGSRAALNYGDPAGDLRLRAELATMLAHTRGMAVQPDDIVVTRGSQMALHLSARALLRPGDVVAVEGLGYRPAWRALEEAGGVLRPVPVDAEGLSITHLERLLESQPVRALYVTPHHQYPTTAVLGAARRLQLLALAKRHPFAILEDDYDHEFHYEGRPIRPLAARAPESVVYFGTLSKVMAPGLRLGWLVAPPRAREAVVAARTYVDRQGDTVLERALAELFEDGEVARHALRMRRLYKTRRDTLAELLHARFGERLDFTLPRGGMALWVHAPGVDTGLWGERAAARGVVVQPGRPFCLDAALARSTRASEYVRLGYGALTPDELQRATKVLLQTMPTPNAHAPKTSQAASKRRPRPRAKGSRQG